MAKEFREEKHPVPTQVKPNDCATTVSPTATLTPEEEARQVDDLLTRWRELEKKGLTASPEELCSGLPNLLPALRRRLGFTDGTEEVSWEAPTEVEKYSFLNPAQQPDEIGRLGGYRVLKPLGAGGMGLVFLAEDSKLKRNIALKVLRPSSNGDRAAADRFLREARAMAALEHDNIVAVYRADEDPDNGTPYLAMQLLRGETLESRLLRSPAGAAPLPIEQVVSLGRQMAQGLAAAHARGLIHRDIKPANIWLEAETNRVKILDFGLARGMQTDVQITSEGAMLGTPAYMAPEQARGQPVDARTDLFSFGCVLYQMCSGHAPFKRDDLLTTLRALELEEPADPSTLAMNIPAPLSRLVLQLLSKNPAHRPASAQTVVEALQVLENQLTGSTAGSADLLNRGKSKGRSLWPIAASVLILAVAGLIWHFYPTTQAAEPVLEDWVGAPPGKRNDFGLKVELVGSLPPENGIHPFLAGDRVAFRIEVERNAFVGIWTVDLDQKIVRLFPNKDDEDNLVLAGKPRVIPGQVSGKGYTIDAEVGKGIECLRVVASTEPLAKLRGEEVGRFSKVEIPTRGLVVKAREKQDTAGMSEVLLKYLVKPRP